MKKKLNQIKFKWKLKKLNFEFQIKLNYIKFKRMKIKDCKQDRNKLNSFVQNITMITIMIVLWSRGGSNDDTTRKCVIRNILKLNSTYINDSWEKPPPQLNTIMNITVLGDGSLRLCRRELSQYMSHEGEFICRGDTPTDSHTNIIPSEELSLGHIFWLIQKLINLIIAWRLSYYNGDFLSVYHSGTKTI